jgi:4-amino-4-deoxy-L-arabinose transferase-like glycosyltransferase
MASAFAFILAVSDVRMESILTASIAFSCWQLADFINQKKLASIFFASLGLALAFSTKGQIGVFVPAIFAFFYILFKKDYSLFINWRWLLLLLFFGIFISPVLYSYYLQYNLHPEKLIRGKDHINGIKFILFNQSIERFSGGMGADSKNDYLFFIHSFLWAFAPWSLLAFGALITRIKNIPRRIEEWGTTGCFIAILLIVSFSGFKLPHYLNIVFPVAAVMTAEFLLRKTWSDRWIRVIYILQIGTAFLFLLVAAFLNVWAFPVKNFLVIASVVLLLAILFYLLQSPGLSRKQKSIAVPVSAMVLFFFLMNANFYPHLLKYQAGQQLVELTKGKVDPSDVYIEKGGNSYSSSYNFYSASLFKTLDDSLFGGKKKIWVLTEPASLERLKQKGYQVGTVYSVPHFRVTKLNLNFLNPSTRDKECSSMMIAELLSKGNQ